MKFKKAAGFVILSAYPGAQTSINDLEFLVLQVSADNKWCYGPNDEFGQWDLPKGGCHGDESAVETAIRETEEETGMRIGKDFIRLKRHKFENGKLSLYVGVMNADAQRRPELTPNPETGELEHEAIGWCSFRAYQQEGMPSLRDPMLKVAEIIEQSYF